MTEDRFSHQILIISLLLFLWEWQPLQLIRSHLDTLRRRHHLLLREQDFFLWYTDRYSEQAITGFEWCIGRRPRYGLAAFRLTGGSSNGCESVYQEPALDDHALKLFPTRPQRGFES